jgi:signal transduction histidine kinase
MRSLRWSCDGMTRSASPLWTAAWPAGLVLGIAAEWLARSSRSLPEAGADLAVGWTLIGCGLLAWSRRPQSRVGLLLTLTGFTWFLGTLAGSRIGPVAALGAALLLVHRGPLCHAIIGYPRGRALDRLSMVVVILAYVCAAAVPLARNDWVTIVVTFVVLAATIRGYALAAGPGRRARVTAIAAAAALAVPLAGGAVARLIGAGPGVEGAVPWGYEAVLVLIAAGFLADMLRGRWVRAVVTRLVVDLGEGTGTGTLQARLAHALGDRSLAIAYWLPETSGYVDEGGNPVVLPGAGSGKAVTMIGQQGEQVAALVCDAAVLDDPGLVEAVASAARMALANVRLRAEVRRQVAELDASRRRILAARDAQRRGLQQALRVGAGQRLKEVEELLDVGLQSAGAAADRAVAARLEDARRELDAAQAELQELAAGIHPAVLAERGFGPALSWLAERAPVPVRLAVPPRRLPAVIETAVYFICSEALTNVGKYAHASRADVAVRADGDLVTVLVADDGVGGADPSAGSGLKGIADRVEALGGRFVVESPAGGGTRLLAEIPAAVRH